MKKLIVALMLLTSVVYAEERTFTSETNENLVKAFILNHNYCEKLLGAMPTDHFETKYDVGYYYATCMSGTYDQTATEIKVLIDKEYKRL